jgi:nucleoid-associated protein YgaU
MPVTSDSRFAELPLVASIAPDGTVRHVVSLRLRRESLDVTARHRIQQGQAVDLLARRLLGDERLWWRLLDANPKVYPLELDLEPGTVINVPAAGPAGRVTRARTF